MSDTLLAGQVGRLNAATTITGATDYVPVYQNGVLRKATPDQIALGQDAVVGPASATDNAIVRFDGTTGELVQNSAVTIADTTGAIVVTGTGSVTVSKTTNQLVLGTTNTTTLNAAAPAASITSNLPLVSGTIATTTGANLFYADVTKCTSSVTKNGSAAFANVTGLSQTVVPGTYQFVCRLPSTVASGTGGIKYAFNYTTTVLTSIEATGRGFTAAAVATQHTTTTTTQTALFTQAEVVIYTEITGSMVVATGGTIDLQMAQNTSNASDTIALLGGTMEFVRIA